MRSRANVRLQSNLGQRSVKDRLPELLVWLLGMIRQIPGSFRQLPGVLSVRRVAFGFIAVLAILFGGIMPAFAAFTTGGASPQAGYAVTASQQDIGHQSDSPHANRSDRTAHEDEAPAKATQAAEQAPDPAPAQPAAAQPAVAAEPAAQSAAEAAPATPPQPACAAGEYAVRKGDTLASIAAAIGYRDTEGKPDWQRIYLCNKDQLGDNPNLIREGWVLKLDNPAPAPAPVPEVAPAAATAPAPPPGPDLSGDSMSLARQIMASPNISFQTSSGQAAFQRIVDTGRATECGGPAISAKLLRVVLQLSQQFKLVLGALTDGHLCDGGQHPLGNAVDINGVNPLEGPPVTGNRIGDGPGDKFDPEEVGIIQQFYQKAGEFLSAEGGGGLGESNCFAMPPMPGNLITFPDVCNHIHLDARNV